MNKRTVVLATAIAILAQASPGFAQSWSAGVKGGVDFAKLGGDIEQILGTSANTRTGFSAGAFAGVDLHRNFRLQLEGQYVQKGTKAEEAGARLTFKVAYIELLLPLTLLIPVEGGAVSPRVYAGPSLAFELSCNAKLEGLGPTIDEDCEGGTVDAPTKKTDFGIIFGGGVDIPAGPGWVTLDALYNLGLTNVNDDPSTTETVKNRNIQLLAGYGFPLGG